MDRINWINRISKINLLKDPVNPVILSKNVFSFCEAPCRFRSIMSFWFLPTQNCLEPILIRMKPTPQMDFLRSG
jgi:hypothetical protein